VLIIAGIAMSIGIPAFQNMIARSRTEGFAHEAMSLIQHTRLEAIKRNRPGVVYLDAGSNELVAFMNIDGDLNEQFNIGAGDVELNRVRKPAFIRFEDETGAAGNASIDGLSSVAGGKPGVVIRPNGSVEADGAFRVADLRGNHLELRIRPAATGRVELRMYIKGSTNPEDGTSWFPPGDTTDPSRVRWEWK